MDEEKTKGEDLCRELFHAEFGQGRRIDEPAVVGDILAILTFDAASILAAGQSETIKLRLRTQTEEARQRGIFGAPSFTTADGELFWGNDRLEPALIWARKKP